MTQGPKRYATGKLYELNITELLPDNSQPRKYFDEQALTELKSSIEKHGVLQPVLVRCGENGGFLLVSGERRYQASLAAGLTTIPAILTKGDPVEIAIVENLLREDLTAIEEAEAINRLRVSHNYQLKDLSGVLGKAESTLCEILSLNKLPDAVKDDVRNDPKAARRVLAEIAKQTTAGKMHALYEKYKANGLTRGEIRGGKITLKGAAIRAAADAASAEEEASRVDLAFVLKFAKHLTAVEIKKLDRAQCETFRTDILTLRLAVNKVLRGLLKALPQKA